MTDERRAELKALAEQTQCKACDGSGGIVLETGPVGEVLLDNCPVCEGTGCTATRQDVPALAAAVRELLAENEQVRADLKLLKDAWREVDELFSDTSYSEAHEAARAAGERAEP